tara:strand:+ start:1010 stop:2425 length:1416 start_codon:yes stop_codon:yes gene_type:complete
MATFSGGTSPAALAALAPSINNLAAARNARSQSISGLMNTIGAGFERNKKQKQVKEKNEIAMGVAKGLLNDPIFRKSVPGITDPASLIKLTSADEVIQFGREQQQINLVTKEAKAKIGLIQTQVKEFERQTEDREAAKESAKALQVLLPTAINLKPGADTTALFEQAALANLTPSDYATLANTISSRTGLDAQVVSENLKSQKALTGATIEEIGSGKLASQAIAGVVSGKIKSLEAVTNFGEMTVDQQGKVISVLKEQNPTAPTPIPMLNPDGSGEILGYALDTGNGNYRIMESAKSGGGLSPTVQANIAALKERTRLDPSDPNYITPEAFEKARGESLRAASLIKDQSGLDQDPAAPDGPPVPVPDVPPAPAPTKNALDVAESLSNLTNIISRTGDLSMDELEQAISAYRSRNTGLSEDDFSEIKNLLVQESKDRKEAKRLRDEKLKRSVSLANIKAKSSPRTINPYGSK